jgi:hypothetical protein
MLYNTLKIPGSLFVYQFAGNTSCKLSEPGFMGLNDFCDLYNNNLANSLIIKITVQTFNWLVNNG